MKLFRKREKKAEVIPLKDALDAVNEFYSLPARLSRLGSGGINNALSGMGGASDKSAFFFTLPFWLENKQLIETFTLNSWAATRFINMPVDDMFTRPREIEDSRFSAAASAVNESKKIADAMKAGRKYGTGLLWAVTKEADAEEPLDVKRIRAGDLVNLLVFDRFSVEILEMQRDVSQPNYMEPLMYRFRLPEGGYQNVHHSRVFRFDGIPTDVVEGWVSLPWRYWGASCLVQALNEIQDDAAAVRSVSHLMQEASIPVQKIDGLSEMLCAGTSDFVTDEPSMDERMKALSMYKSIYRTLFMDSRDDFMRVAVQFSGLPDLLDKYAQRLATTAGISATRFLGKSPDGMNSTGEGDMRNDNRTTAVRQIHWLSPAYNFLDPIIAASAGLTEAPEYTFPPLFEPTRKESGEVDKLRAETANIMIQQSVWDESEAKGYVATGMLPDED